MKFKRMFALLLLAMGLIVANTAEATGAVGPQGPTGKKGPTGDKGLRGDKGATGNTGATGATGRTGAAGPKGGGKGDKGLQGDKGDAGTNGTNGAKGDQGLPGIQGDKGLQGDKGDAGTNGTNGGKGDQGLPGDKGLQGDKGDAGTQIANGTTTGDMLYWDETQIKWVVLPAPNPLPTGVEMATLHFCNGAPTWKAMCFPPSNGTTYSIGGNGPAGGTVIYITDGGLHGLEAAPESSIVLANWGCIGSLNPNFSYTYVGTTSSAFGTGATNTANIMAACPADVNSAAQIAHAYTLGGYVDWYLPSKDELALVEQNAPSSQGGAVWSSTEDGVTLAWYQQGALISQYYQTKNVMMYVKPIHNF